MQISVHAKGFDLTPGLRAHVEQRLASVLDRFDKDGAQVQVTLEDVNGPRGGLDKRCCIHLRGLQVKAEPFEATESDLYAAIDAAADRAAHWMSRESKREKPTFPDRTVRDSIRKRR